MINMIGSMLSCSGYDAHFRNLARALGKITDVRLSIQAGQGWKRLVDDKELEMIKKQPVDDEINLIVTNPLYWKLNTDAKRNWAFLVFEGDKIPKCYLDECFNEDIEYIFVPSEHVKQAVINICDWADGNCLENYQKSTLKDKIKIIPHGVDLNLFYPKQKPEKFTFVSNKGFRNLEDRGGQQYLIKAYFEEFTDKDNVELLLKINPAYGIPDLQQMINKLAPRKENLPLLNIDIQNYLYNKLVDLYNRGTVFVSPTRAEAYNLGCIEACAVGIPCIVTGYGGQIDFIKDEVNGLYIDYELEKVKHETLYEGISWATPSIKDLRKKLRWAYEHPEEIKKLGENALETARKNTWEVTAQKVVDLI